MAAIRHMFARVRDESLALGEALWIVAMLPMLLIDGLFPLARRRVARMAQRPSLQEVPKHAGGCPRYS